MAVVVNTRNPHSAARTPRFGRMLAWPFRGLWRAASAIERRLGIASTLLAGLAASAIGLVLILSLAGLLAGIPLLALGLAMVLRALY